ncbi:MarR family winged helix-turn-helix transcriptional regulator [Streptomyces flavovirens]|uniref:MarR family winged helix-turn-helix transcriptional regulator n=1 Tax=Streptomyces flavovirens TaxID=52258 RepID=UPI003D0D44DF
MYGRDTEGSGPGDDLAVAAEHLVRHVRRSSRAGGLSPTAASTLGRLGREGPRRLTDLARDEGVSQPNMTQLVNRMERDGLARRVADARDGRGVLVEATDHGLAVFRQRRAERAEALRRLVDELSEPERRAVETALPALARVIEDQAPGP